MPFSTRRVSEAYLVLKLWNILIWLQNFYNVNHYCMASLYDRCWDYNLNNRSFDVVWWWWFHDSHPRWNVFIILKKYWLHDYSCHMSKLQYECNNSQNFYYDYYQHDSTTKNQCRKSHWQNRTTKLITKKTYTTLFYKYFHYISHSLIYASRANKNEIKQSRFSLLDSM